LDDIRRKGNRGACVSFDGGDRPEFFDIQDLDELIGGEQGPVVASDFEDVALGEPSLLGENG